MRRWPCRVLHSLSELEQFVGLEMAVWGLDARDAVPTSILHAMTLNGSLVIGAFDDHEMVGMALAFPAPRGRKWRLWSHMAGVRPDYQGKGVGSSLKQFQRTWALDNGYSTIVWTFDPLQRGNANFNLHQLGVTAQIYHVNLYGDMTDGINAGLPSDRLEVSWDLRQARVKALAQGRASSPLIKEQYFLLQSGRDAEPQLNLDFDSAPQTYLVEIPADLATLKRTSPQAALAWRMALRQTLEAAFAKGYRAVDFVNVDNRCCYVLSGTEPWFLYVLECNDQTLYTGVTPDLQRRLKQHNAGHGAAYTAAHRPVKMVAAWRFTNRSDALKAELGFKKQSRQTKLAYIMSKRPYNEAPFVDEA